MRFMGRRAAHAHTVGPHRRETKQDVKTYSASTRLPNHAKLVFAVPSVSGRHLPEL